MPGLIDCKMPVTPELPRAAHERFESFVEEAALPPKVVFAADTALEELLQNLVDYSGAHEVRLQMSVEAGEFRIDLSDDGRPFNPLETTEPDMSVPVEQRDIGGLGIFLAKRMMDRVVYAHDGILNHVQLVKLLG